MDLQSASTATIAALAALGGVALSSAISVFQSWLTRRWNDAELLRKLRGEAIERRVGQAEGFAEIMTKAFYEAHDDCAFYLRCRSTREAARRSEAFVARREGVDRAKFLYAPAILSLDDKVLNESWFRMGDELGAVVRLSATTLQDKFLDHKAIDPTGIENQAHDFHLRYRDAAAEFLRRLDYLRSTIR